MDKSSNFIEKKNLIDRELRDVFKDRSIPLYDMMAYHFGWVGDQGADQNVVKSDYTHGVLCLASCEAIQGDLSVCIPAAASLELVNGFSQIHDDVQGGHPQRDGRDSVWWLWGPAQAINAGDGMHALARLAMFKLKEKGVSTSLTFRAVKMLDEANLSFCEGRFRDLEAQERIDLSIDEYLKMASGKTASFFSCAMALGALVGGADDKLIDGVSICGDKLGMALQIRDDIREMWGTADQPPSLELLNKKKILPLVHALEQGKLAEKRRISEVFFKRVLDPKDIETLRAMLAEIGSKEYCHKLLENYRQEAIIASDVAGLSIAGKKGLRTIIDSVIGLEAA